MSQNIYYYLLLSLIVSSCRAQTIIPYNSEQDIFVPNSGDYYKDTDNVFNTFEGEWKWENTATNSSLSIIFDKVENLDSGENFTYDLLIGEYRYIENGVELANTLSDIDNPDIIGENHKISGHEITTKYSKPECTECSVDEKRIRVIIEHDNYEGVYGWLLLRQFTEGGVEKIKAIIYDGSWLASDDSAPDDIDIPFGDYILIKQ